MAQHFGEMHFAALDVLYHHPSGKAVICEGNTAPGLENNTVNIYAEYLLGLNEEFRKERMVVL
jgi:D-alanine-D-alanine ligase-like ATP-grasp enzyme